MLCYIILILYYTILLPYYTIPILYYAILYCTILDNYNYMMISCAVGPTTATSGRICPRDPAHKKGVITASNPKMSKTPANLHVSGQQGHAMTCLNVPAGTPLSVNLMQSCTASLRVLLRI